MQTRCRLWRFVAHILYAAATGGGLLHEIIGLNSQHVCTFGRPTIRQSCQMDMLDDYQATLTLGSFHEHGTQSLPSLFVYTTQQIVREAKHSAFVVVIQKNKHSNSGHASGERG